MPDEIITSPQNARIRHLRRLRTTKGRATEQFLLEGATLLKEAQAAGWELEAVYYSADPPPQTGSVPSFRISDRLLQSASELEHSPGILAVARKKLTPPARLRIPTRALLLDRLQDPGNVGTLIRSAAAFGCDAVLSTPGTAHFFNPKVVRAAMGALFHLQLCEAIDPASVKALLDREQAVLVCADSRSGKTPETLAGGVRHVLAVGHETGGLSPALQRLCGDKVHIPVASSVESLNAGVAGSLLLYALANRGRRPKLGASTKNA